MLENSGKMICNKFFRMRIIPSKSLKRTITLSSFNYTGKSSSEGGHHERSQYSSEKETHFGFETVSEAEKAQKVKSVFENVADRYDIMNDCMSVGVHRIWKDIFVHRINPGPNTKLIDVAGGTGDIAFRFLKFQSQNGKNDSFIPTMPNPLEMELPPDQPDTPNEVDAQYLNQSLGINQDNQETITKEEPISRSVLVSDINPKMLEVGQIRAKSALNSSELQRIDWLEADAENLSSVPDNTFDVYTIAFGIRNCVHVENVVQEAYRVLKPGGRFMCLEFSQVPNSLIRWIYDQYSFQVIPAMGQVIAGDWNSYQYLVESIRKFPDQETFKAIIQRAGFRFVNYENLSFGVTAIHSGYKI